MVLSRLHFLKNSLKSLNLILCVLEDWSLWPGDFNFHVDEHLSCSNTITFMDLLHSFNLTQHISGPTHKNNHTLDLIITRSDEQFAWNFSVHDPGISDHFAVHCYLSIKKPPALKKEFTYRKLRSVDLTQFNLDVANSPLLSSSESSLAPLCDQYDTIISAIVDSHAPVHKKLISPRPAAPWYTGDIDVEKTKRRNLERRWRRSGLHIDRQMYLEQCQLVKGLIYSTKMNYFSSLIVENKPNPNALFQNHRSPTTQKTR
jgi:hypothetical protein